MADTTNAAPQASTGNSLKLPSFGSIVEALRQADIGLAVGVMAILVVLILPMPAVLLDSCWRFRSCSRCWS